MKGSVNKGFFSYLLLFLGLIFGVILICFTIMMFSPGTAIFGWIYVRENTEYKIETYDGKDGCFVVDSNGEIISPNETASHFNFEELSTLNIKSYDSSINVIHGEYDQIIVNNKVKGFVKEEQNVNLTIKKFYDSSTKTLTLTIIDKNPKLTLSNNKSVDVYLSGEQYNNLNLNFEIENKGSIDIGSKFFNSNSIRGINLNSLKAKTNSGRILVSNNDMFYTKVSLQTVSGNIECKRNLVVEGYVSLLSVDFKTQSGQIKAEDISADSISFTAKQSYVNVGNLVGYVKCSVESGDFRTGNIDGDLDDPDDVVRNTNFVVGDVSGCVTIPHATKSDFSVGQVEGAVLVSTDTGRINIKKILGKAEIVTISGKVDVLIGENNVYDIKISTDTGSVNAKFLTVLNSHEISTNSGDIFVAYLNILDFKLTAKTSKNIYLKSENIKKSNEEIVGYPSIIDSPFETTYSLSINSKSGDIEILSSSSVAELESL